MTADSVTAGPAEQVRSRASVASDYGYPHGHLGHLSEYEEEHFQEFKKILGERGLYKAGPPPSHEDPVLLRFLRARRWNVEDAYKQFKDTEEWREANDIDMLYHTIELDAYEQSRRVYPQWTGRRDRRGIPVFVFLIKNLDSKTVANYEKTGKETTFTKAKWDGKTPPGLLRLFALYENLTRFTQPFCTQLQDREFPGTPITMSTNIVDISGVSLKQFWNLKSHMQAASQLATAHYPETLDRIFIIGAPVFFSTVWGWVKRWFDPITVSKIFILSPHEVKPTLESFIDLKNVPKQYGGELEFNFGDMPNPDPAWDGVVSWENGHTSFIPSPMVWRPTDDGQRVECIGLGHVNGKERNERICTVPMTWSPPPATVEVNGAIVSGENETAAAATAPAEGRTESNHEDVKGTEQDQSEGTKKTSVDAAESQDPTQIPPPAADLESKAVGEATDKPAITTGEEIAQLAISEKEKSVDKGSKEVGEKVQAPETQALPTTVI